MSSTTIIEGNHRVHPKKFALWVAMASIIMMFAALTSAYIVRKSQGEWLDFQLPDAFFYSTGVLLITSVILHMAYKAFLAANEQLYKILIFIGFILGLTFIALQYFGWLALNDIGIFLQTNPSSGFLFLISGLHVIHVLGGVTALLVVFYYTFAKRFEVTPKRKLRLEMVFSYWHFVDILWVYLFVFFLIQQ